MLYAAQDKNIAGLILWSAPNDLRKAVINVMGYESYAKLERGEVLHLNDERGECDITPDFLTDYDALRLEEKYLLWDKRPVLLLHCEADEQVPVAQARENVQALGECCEAHIFPNGNHSIGDYSKETGIIIERWLAAKTAD